ncbi:hypothetical protein [Streptomyces eurythermus]
MADDIGGTGLGCLDLVDRMAARQGSSTRRAAGEQRGGGFLLTAFDSCIGETL